ncbi:TPA: FKBP-type peptidyl-prolyl cis-trans isomerase N-terminal domain-containing protein [Escherichia coli]
MSVRKFYLFRRLPGFWESCFLGLLFCLTNNALASEDENIPGIMQYIREQEMTQNDGVSRLHNSGQDSTYIAGAELKRQLSRNAAERRQLKEDNRQLRAELKEMEAKIAGMPVVDMEQLNSPEKQQAYAAGVMMGRDILSLQAADALSGITTDNRVLLAGVWDALNHREQMSENVLQAALSQAEQSIHEARQKTALKWKKAGSDWLKSFKKQKGVQQDRSGFWYLIEHGGDGGLISGDSTVVDVVVVEKMTDGTVVEDMDARGTVVSRPLGDYPPLFRSALLLLKNHGTITVAAPPELAYGDAGYPPKVPPGATMIYTIRVENVREEKVSPEGQKQEKTAQSNKAEEARKS